MLAGTSTHTTTREGTCKREGEGGETGRTQQIIDILEVVRGVCMCVWGCGCGRWGTGRGSHETLWRDCAAAEADRMAV